MYTMIHKGFKAQIMEAERLVGDYTHHLPPGRATDVYPSYYFVNYPENWIKEGAYVVPVKPNKGLWFNFRQNSENNTAVILTIKGCNPITGMQTSGFFLEKYETKCPRHGCSFVHDRFCPECNYNWPDRSYLSMSPLWWDGWRNADGTVRQFFFSEEELRDVASALIGKENTVPAFGFAFYAPKERRSEPAAVYLGGTVYKYAGSAITDGESTKFSPILRGSAITDGESTKSFSPILRKRSFSKSLSSTKCSTKSFDFFEGERERGLRLESSRRIDSDSLQEAPKSAERQERKEPVKEVSIGAGAPIDQKLTVDPYELSSWKEAPDSVMTIYFVFQEKFEELKAKGVRDLEGSKEGILSGCIVG